MLLRWLAFTGAIVVALPALIWPRQFLDRTGLFRPRDERDAARWVAFTRLVAGLLLLAGVGALLGWVQIGNSSG